MTTISELGIAVHSESAVEAADNLDKLAASGVKAEQAAGRVVDAWDEARQRMGISSRESRKALDDQRQALDKLVGQIDPTVAALGRLDKQQQELRKYRAAGILDAESFAEYNSKIEAARTAIGTFSGDLDRTGKTAKETAFAMRGLPAQFTDIFTSLAAGQPAMMVFLQQGGQIKDMFGGIGPAARAMGSYVLGLVNPFTLAAAAVGTLAAAYYQGSREQDAYRLGLVSTGNAAGATVGQLADMAQRISASTGTTSKAAEVLAQLASSGKVAASSFQEVATAAIAWEKAGGQAASTTVAEFAKLADDPVRAVAALDEKYNFLTASVYEQIRALEEQGNTEAASEVAQSTFADALERRSRRLTENLGYIEKGWNAVWGAAKGAWDAMADIGRDAGPEQRLAALQTLLSDYEAAGSTRMAERLRGEISRLQISTQAAELDAATEGLRAENFRKGREAYDSLQKTIESAATRQQKLQKALLESEREINAARAAGFSITEEQQALIEKQIREKFKERIARVPGAREDAGMARIATLGRENAALLEQLSTTQKLTAGERELAKFTQEIADLRERKVLTAQQKQIVASEDEIRAELNKRIELEKQIKLKEEDLRLTSYRAALDSQNDQARSGLDASLKGLELGDVERQRAQELIRIAEQYEQQRRRLQAQENQKQISPEQYKAQATALEESLRERLQMQRDYYQQVDEAQQDWTKGARAAYGSYLESAKDIAGQTKNLFTNAFSSMEDAIVQFAMTGKLSFADFAKSVLADMARIATRQAATGILSSVVGSIASAWAGSAGAGTGATAGDYTGTDYSNWVAGQRASGGPVAPNSLYEVNELGPELLSQGGRTYLMTGQQGGSVVPLGSGLASASAAGAGASTQINVAVNIASDGSAEVTSDKPMAEQFGREIGALIEQKYRQLLSRDLKRDGAIGRAING